MREYLQSTARRVTFEAYLASDHLTPATGKTIAVTISKNGAAFGNPNAGATNATAIGSGSYYVDLDTTDTATLGPIVVKGTEGTIDDVKVHADVVKATNRGATALPDTAVSSNASLVTVGTGTAQISLSSGQVLLQSGTGTGQISLSSGTVTVGAIGNNVITTASINNGAFTDAKFTVPAVSAALATGPIGMIQQVHRDIYAPVKLDRVALTKTWYANNGTTVLYVAHYTTGTADYHGLAA